MAEGAAAPAPTSPSPLPYRLVLKEPAAGCQKQLGGLLCSIGSCAWTQMSPRAVPGSRDQLKLQDLGVNVKGGQLWGGVAPSQGKVSLNPQKFRSWHLFNHPLIPYSCWELIIACKSENTQYAYLLKEWNSFPF